LAFGIQPGCILRSDGLRRVGDSVWRRKKPILRGHIKKNMSTTRWMYGPTRGRSFYDSEEPKSTVVKFAQVHVCHRAIARTRELANSQAATKSHFKLKVWNQKQGDIYCCLHMRVNTELKCQRTKKNCLITLSFYENEANAPL
jgi:hypothetical protein